MVGDGSTRSGSHPATSVNHGHTRSAHVFGRQRCHCNCAILGLAREAALPREAWHAAYSINDRHALVSRGQLDSATTARQPSVLLDSSELRQLSTSAAWYSCSVLGEEPHGQPLHGMATPPRGHTCGNLRRLIPKTERRSAHSVKSHGQTGCSRCRPRIWALKETCGPGHDRAARSHLCVRLCGQSAR